MTQGNDLKLQPRLTPESANEQGRIAHMSANIAATLQRRFVKL